MEDLIRHGHRVNTLWCQVQGGTKYPTLHLHILQTGLLRVKIFFTPVERLEWGRDDDDVYAKQNVRKQNY